MKVWHWLRHQRWTPVPGTSALSLSLLVHFVVLFVVVVVLRWPAPRIESRKYQVVELKPGKAYLYPSASAAPPHARPARMRRGPMKAQTKEAASTSTGLTGEALREQAQQQTAAITMSLRFHGVYGFYPGPEYKLAVQTAGEIPVISAGQVPLHFQQYVIVEVTIDTQGQVADARIVAGIVDPAIQQTLLSTIREFKFHPAKRDGVPIPSQRDYVIHIPS